MQHSAFRARRKLLVASIGVAAAAIGAGVVATRGGNDDGGLRFASLAEARDEIRRLVHARTVTSLTAWNWAQTLTHCAQSIEYSMTGFPQMKPALFQRTVGAAAIGVFAWRGRMTHDLAEPIPGAPALDAAAPAAAASERLEASMQAFLQWRGPLRPHFAYGDLAKPEYERAHAMHVANHLSAFRPEA
jgi:hypothetical protein